MIFVQLEKDTKKKNAKMYARKGLPSRVINSELDATSDVYTSILLAVLFVPLYYKFAARKLYRDS